MNGNSQMLKKIISMIKSLGFSEVYLERSWTKELELNFIADETYFKPTYIGKSCFVIEYADSIDDAKKNLYEDGDSFPLEMGETAILEGIRNELMREISSTEILDSPPVKAHAI